MVKLLSIVLIGISCFTLMAIDNSEEKETKLTVLFDNIRNKNGDIYIFIYSYENQYPNNPYLNFKVNKAMVSDFGTLKFIIPEYLMQGAYAISILDDENSNEDLDTFLGIPTEGYGFSNNVSPMLSLPKYDTILFDLDKNKKTVYLTLQYIF